MSKIDQILDIWENPMKDLYDLEVETLLSGIHFNNKNQINLEESLNKVFYVVDRYSNLMFNSQHEYTSLTIFRDDQLRFSVLDENKNVALNIVIPTFSPNLIKEFMDIAQKFENKNFSFKIFMQEKGRSRIRFEEKSKLMHPEDISKEITKLFHNDPSPKVLSIVQDLIDKRNIFNIHSFIIKYNNTIDDEIKNSPGLEENVPDEFTENVRLSFESTLSKSYEGIKLKTTLLNMLKK